MPNKRIKGKIYFVDIFMRFKSKNFGELDLSGKNKPEI